MIQTWCVIVLSGYLLVKMLGRYGLRVKMWITNARDYRFMISVESYWRSPRRASVARCNISQARREIESR
jgi:hypothetical protein